MQFLNLVLALKREEIYLGCQLNIISVITSSRAVPFIIMLQL